LEGQQTFYRIVQATPTGKILLEVPYPNPAVESFTLRFSVDQPSAVTITLLDAAGKYRTTMIDEQMERGTYLYQFGVEGLPAGIYFIRMQVRNQQLVRKLIIQK
jgi:hypothetical protein